MSTSGTPRRPGPLAPGAGAAAVAGVAAGAVTTGTGTLVALATGPSTDPLVAVGAAFVDATPPWLKDWAATTFGTADKGVLTVGTVVVLALLAALAGVLARWRWPAGAVLVVALGGVAGLAAAGRPDAGALAPLPSVAGAVAGLLVLRALLARLPEPEGTAAADEDVAHDDVGAGEGATAGPGTTRRRFVQATALAGGAGVVALVLGRIGGTLQRGTTALREAVRLPAPARTAPPLGDVDLAVPGADPWATPVDEFYRIDTALVVPGVEPATWTLRVHGLVEEEVVLTWDELLGSDLVEAWVTLTCVSNRVGGDLVGNQRWLGLPVREVLARARPTGDADMVLSRSVDGFTASTPLEVLTDDRDALLAVAMDGQPLPAEHGFPVRMVVPGLYGYVSATKWVTELEVTRFDAVEAYWTQRGWSARGPVKTQSRVDVPRTGAQVSAGEVVVAGTAWAQHRGVVGVQVRVDDGPWVDAELAADGGIDSWRQWRLVWAAEPGEHTLRVRALDPDGPQTGVPTGVVPDGATGYHAVDVTVV